MYCQIKYAPMTASVFGFWHKCVCNGKAWYSEIVASFGSNASL